MKAEARVHALADTVEVVGAETLYDTLSNMKSEMLVYVLHDMPVKAASTQRAKRLAFKLEHVDFDALLNTLVHTLA